MRQKDFACFVELPAVDLVRLRWARFRQPLRQLLDQHGCVQDVQIGGVPVDLMRAVRRLVGIYAVQVLVAKNCAFPVAQVGFVFLQSLQVHAVGVLVKLPDGQGKPEEGERDAEDGAVEARGAVWK